MKANSLIFLLCILLLTVNLNAQNRVTTGTISITGGTFLDSDPLIRTRALFDSPFHVSTSFNDMYQGKAISVFVNRRISSLTYSIQPSLDARGDLAIPGAACTVSVLTNPNSPYTTKLDFTFGDILVPRFTPGQQRAQINVPFTMSGRVSCFSGPDPFISEEVIGSGTVRLGFWRVGADRKPYYLQRVFLRELNFTFTDTGSNNP